MLGGNYFKQGVGRSFSDAKLVFGLVRIALSLPFVLLTVVAVFVAVLSGILGAIVSGKTKQIKDFL